MVIIATCNARFKDAYSRYIGLSFLIAATVHVLLFCFSPPFHFSPYTMPVDDGPIRIEPEPIFDEPVPPPSVPSPSVNIEPAKDGEQGEDPIDVPPNTFGDFREFLPPPPIAAERPIDFYPFDQAPVLLSTVRPVYPELSRQAGIEGRVLLCVLIGVDGTVLKVSVMESNVTPAMATAAIAAVRQFRFIPAKQGPVPVRAQMAVPVDFRLH